MENRNSSTKGIGKRNLEEGIYTYSINKLLISFKLSINHINGILYTLTWSNDGVLTWKQLKENRKGYIKYIRDNG